MTLPAARMTDMHACPMVDGPKPHAGGPILPPCSPTVLVGGLPAARLSDMAICVGPLDAIAQGSETVLVGRLPASRMSDMSFHSGIIVTGCPTVLVGGPAVPSTASLLLAIKLIDIKGTADVSDAVLVARELAKFPPHMLKILDDNGTRVAVCRGSITEYRTDLAGVHPRGYRPGSTWDTVPGSYSPSRDEVVIATTGHGTPQGPHVPAAGEGHGSSNAVLHEAAHAIDNHTGASSGRDFNDARNADSDTLSRYQSQPGSAGQQETYAESAARYYGGDPDDATDHPNLHNYWDSDPLNPNP